MFDQAWLQEMLIVAPVLILSLTLHEFAHARTALAFGDPTALMAGRVSLNPLRHLDPIGTAAMLLVGFGWARPVPVNPANLHPPRLGDVCVSLAGVATNLMLAVACGLIARLLFALAPHMNPQLWALLVRAAIYAASVNVTLCVFNLIPLAPLDGHHVLAQMVNPWRRADFLRWQMQYGQPILLALLFVPRFFSRAGGTNIPDPLGWLLGRTQYLFWQVISPF
jgi:Zn-dependent protease